MSAVVSSIFSAVTSTVTTALGATYKALPKIYNLEENDFRIIDKAYAVRHGASSFADGITRVYTMDQRFEVVLVNRAVTRNNDNDIQTAINTLYDKADDILRSAFGKKLGLSNVIINVDSPEISEPQILDNSAVVLIVAFNVKYRQSIT